MYRTIKHIRHLVTSTNQHGVHSPFVYDYVTKCLYTKQKHSKKASINILLKSIAYFKVETLLLLTEDEELKKIVVRKFPAVQLGGSSYDLIYSEASDLRNIKKLFKKGNMIHNGTVLFVNNIHQEKATEIAWEKLKTNEKVRVTINLFYFGIVFFREEQAKEHFKIRI